MHIFIYYTGKPPDENTKIKALNLKPNTKIMMMGTREENLVNIYNNVMCVH
jgi:ubiquitin-like domain-containing CTD phosphatase 1